MSLYSPTTASSPKAQMPLSHESSFDIVFDRHNHDRLMEQLFKTKSGRDAFKRRKKEVSDGVERKALGIKSVKNLLLSEQVRIRKSLAVTDPSQTEDLQVHLHHYGFRRDWQLLMAITQRLSSKPEPERRVRIGKERRWELERAWKDGKPIGMKPSPLRRQVTEHTSSEPSRLRQISVGLKLVIAGPTDGPWSTESELLSPVDFLPDQAMQTLHAIIPGQDVDDSGERHVGAAECGDLSNPCSPSLGRTRLSNHSSPNVAKLQLDSPALRKLSLHSDSPHSPLKHEQYSPRKDSPRKGSPRKLATTNYAKPPRIRQTWSMSRVVGWFFATSR